MKVAVFSDDVYRRTGGRICADLSFPQFIAGLAPSVDGLTLIGRLDHDPGPCRHPLPANVRLVGLERFSKLTGLPGLLALMWRSLPRLWRGVDEADTVVVMGPHPLALLLVPIALVRRRRLVLGVRQQYPSYIAARHPDSPAVRRAAAALEWAFLTIAAFVPVVVVGPELAARYRHARSVHDLRVSLIAETEIEEAPRDYSGNLRVLSVGRIAPDKNPLLLAEIAAGLASLGERWRLSICGEGELRDELERKLADLGLDDRVELLGFVTGEDLHRQYRDSHFLLHVAHTEGVPQVLYEAFATGLPVVATDVGGVRAASAGAARLIPPRHAQAAIEALHALAEDSELRRRTSQAALHLARLHSRERELARLATFLHACP